MASNTTPQTSQMAHHLTRGSHKVNDDLTNQVRNEKLHADIQEKCPTKHATAESEDYIERKRIQDGKEGYQGGQAQNRR